MAPLRAPRDLEALRAGGKSALAAALAAVEGETLDTQSLRVLDACYCVGTAHVIGLTGPPGVGKSTLTAALVQALRAADRTVGVIAVDPSSKRSKGAMLGDRARIVVDAEDAGVFVRSLAARERLGGLAAAALPAVVLMRAVYDTVLIETVGVGQSETAIEQVADTVLFAIQPASGDALQFMKAGIAEIPDIAVITKADLGAVADKAARDLQSALKVVAAKDDAWTVRVHKVAAPTGAGMHDLLRTIDAHRAYLQSSGRLRLQRAAQGEAWLEDMIREEFGRRGLRAWQATARPASGTSPFSRFAPLLRQTDDVLSVG